MKVSEIMQIEVDKVPTDATVREISRVIFGRNINGVPVCKGKKVVGFITERDILTQFYPTLEEYMEDPVHMSNFEIMEKNIDGILNLPANKIMNENPIIVSPDTPVLQAQALMFTRKVGRLPVVDKKGNLIGIVSKRDIFRTLVGKKLPFGEEEEFYDWIARYYDLIIDWKTRLSSEVPDLVQLLKKARAKKILDVASSTGEHMLALAKEGFDVYGLETSPMMYKTAQGKKSKLADSLQSKLTFIQGDYRETVQQLPGSIDAALFMGNALSHVMHTDKNIVSEVSELLHPKKSLMILQIANYQKIFQTKEGMHDFVLRRHPKNNQEFFFLEFYTKIDTKETIYTRVVFEFDGMKWTLRGINSTPIIPVGQKQVVSMLKKLGFSYISSYGGKLYSPLFEEQFDPMESDWLNVVAKR